TRLVIVVAILFCFTRLRSSSSVQIAGVPNAEDQKLLQATPTPKVASTPVAAVTPNNPAQTSGENSSNPALANDIDNNAPPPEGITSEEDPEGEQVVQDALTDRQKETARLQKELDEKDRQLAEKNRQLAEVNKPGVQGKISPTPASSPTNTIKMTKSALFSRKGKPPAYSNDGEPPRENKALHHEWVTSKELETKAVVDWYIAKYGKLIPDAITLDLMAHGRIKQSPDGRFYGLPFLKRDQLIPTEEVEEYAADNDIHFKQL